MAKYLTRSEAATAKDKAVRLMESTGQSDRAGEFRRMSVEEYAEHRGATLMDNPRGRRAFMARKDEMEDQIETIEDLVEEALDPELTREELVPATIASTARTRARTRYKCISPYKGTHSHMLTREAFSPYYLARRHEQNSSCRIAMDLRSAEQPGRLPETEVDQKISTSAAAEDGKRLVSRPVLRQACFDDYDQIAALLLRNGLSPRLRTSWNRSWRDNAAYEQVRDVWPIGWVLEAQHGRIVGFVGNIPSLYLWNGALIRSATACDWVVDPEYRCYSLLLFHEQANQPHVDLLLSTTVSAAAEPSFRMFHWSKPPVGEWNKVAFWITNYHGFIRSVFAKRRIRFAAPLSSLTSVVGSCYERLAGQRDCRPPSLRIDRRADFDASFDVFWGELQRRKPSVLLALRSRQALAWHFHAAQADPWIVTASDSSGLLAYAIFVRRDSPETALRRLRLADFQALSDDADTLEQLLSCVQKQCYVDGIHVIEDVGCVLESRGLTRAPHHRTLRAWSYYYKTKRADLFDALQDARAWSPSGLDGDANL